MASEKKESKKLITKLRNKYRLVILNDDTFEEKLSFKLSRLNVFVVSGLSVILLIAGTTLLIAFTPLREYIPGYSSTALKRDAIRLAQVTDSLENQLNYNSLFLQNIQGVINGQEPLDLSDDQVVDSLNQSRINLAISKDDSLLRKMVEEEEQFNIPVEGRRRLNLESLNFFIPIKGLVTQAFNPEEEHLGIDIVAKENEVIKATQDGRVIFAEWTAETGYVMIIQHAEKFISVYKHNSALLKAQGQDVSSGEPIAIIGNSGELSSGPHLHFELWYNGYAVDPQEYISF
ncbi:M23 family metallopeptidase [Croceimicrobium hydrocarbonivorans]|uniref:M23 family metallopeptidase n=1 Tax=Croceimicrobium hydrocarbonivorans TaxID=2761580 RepID=A0A7H0VJG6_9FLAO|nr:M23 family metallopeptidase [Croceimicrobium hydrocarbonivorans]QNR25864.1 M23 family metallopeptidase [Croceimicrobium hydrocarbonivorans]